ncbi:hypothetical protein [Paraburkholderia caribensis]|uniref:hypothetical protein n=1 Tax=Paraburkholderia caribensis TaxID=75105 RepID=UPI001D085FE5|nr:hypothetical protein [Paraburkholderia caribensis]
MSDVQATSAAPVDTSGGPDLASIASRLYRNTEPTLLDKPAEQPKPAQQAATTQQTPEDKPADAKPAEATTADATAQLPDALRELRDDPLRRMFSPQGTFASVPLEDAMKHLPLDGEAKAAEAAEWREQFEDFGASPQDARELVDAARRFVAEPMTPQRDMANVNAAIEAMNREFGNDAAKALADAQAMVKRDPRLVKILESSRLGNDPTTVVKLARLARSQRQRG